MKKVSNSEDKALKEEILNDSRMDRVYALGLETLSSGRGSGTFRGEAGVMIETIDRLREWAGR